LRPVQCLESTVRQRASAAQKVALMIVGVSLLPALVTGCSGSTAATTSQTSRSDVPTESSARIESQPAGIETYALAMKRFREMDVDSFEQLPRDSRLAYAQYLIDQTVSRGTYDYLYGVGTRSESACAITPTESHPEDDGQQILDNNTFNLQIAYAQFIEADSSSKSYDKEDGQKLLSAAYYQVGMNRTVSNDYIATQEQLQGLTKPASISNINTALDSSDLMSGKTEDGEVVKYKYVTYRDNVSENITYARFIYREFTSYDGKNKSAWLFHSASNESIEDLKW